MCQSLFQELCKIEERLRMAARVSLFLDFDGTLAPLKELPGEARLDTSTRETLARIAHNERIVTTIVSGRAVSDLRSRIGLESLVYAGNHGLEICGRQLSFLEPTAAARQEELQRLSNSLAAKLEPIAGTVVECKGLTTSVHYRGAAVREFARIEDTIRALTAPAAESFVVRPGKMAFEIVPRTGWHKGSAVLWISQRLGSGKALPIYVGDDTSDEDAFCALPEGITVKVGNFTLTSARYYLADPVEVHEFLMWLANHVPARTAAN
jgi:trehalose 6-phosphate phosphatase